MAEDLRRFLDDEGFEVGPLAAGNWVLASVVAAIDGRSRQPAHGSRDMPIMLRSMALMSWRMGWPVVSDQLSILESAVVAICWLVVAVGVASIMLTIRQTLLVLLGILSAQQGRIWRSSCATSSSFAPKASTRSSSSRPRASAAVPP